MKFMKKSAALFFCLALAFSVMAVTASATEDTAQLMGTEVNNTDFVITLVKADTSSAILDRDKTSTTAPNNGYEIDSGTTVTFDIKLAYGGTAFKNSTDATPNTIDAFQFEFDKDNSGGATVAGVKITDKVNTDHTVTEATQQDNVYAYTAGGYGDHDIAITSAATKIGTISFTLTAKASQDATTGVTPNTAITPKIKNIKIQVRGTEASQIPAETTGGETTPANPGTEYPIWVNPTYTATVQKFEANSNSGYLAGPKMSGNAIDKEDVTYYFTTGANLTNADDIPGYDFQGWIVTADTDNSTTWADGSGSWTKNVYFGKSDDWSTNSRSLVAVNANTANERQDITFIPKGSGNDSPVIPTHMVGDITLTPVYTATTYTATFNAGATTASFKHSPPASKVSNIEQYTKTYTIEDLYDATQSTDADKVVDYLDLLRTQSGQNKDIYRKAYKFDGWALSNVAAPGDYAWAVDASSVHNLTQADDILTTKTAGHYGNVTFTAVWSEAIYFAQVAYKYAGANNSLFLVGVPNTDDYEEGYTYKCGDNAMFIIPSTAAQRGMYVTQAQNVTKANSSDKLNPDFTADNLTSNYVIYAYIAADTTAVADITIVENANITQGTKGNNELSYTGDVDGDGVSVSDFGNVDTLFNNSASTVYSTTTSAGVKSRLLADYDTTATAETNFGSISDIVAIYNVMGYGT